FYLRPPSWVSLWPSVTKEDSMRTWPPALRAAVALALAAIAFLSMAAAPAASRPRLSAHYAEARALLARMTLEEKVGQMTQAEQSQLKDVKDIQTYFLGSLLSGGDSDPKTNSLQDWTDMYDRYQEQALQTRLKIPIVYGVDAVHGHNNVLG